MGVMPFVLPQLFKAEMDKKNSEDFLHYNSIIIIHNGPVFSSYSIANKQYE